MRKKQQDQMPLMMTSIDHPRAEELKRISEILDQYRIMSEMVWQDLTCQGQKSESGARGMSAEQVLRAAIVKQTEGFSYEELAFHLLDSRCYRTFCRIGVTHKGIKKSALALAIKSISPSTWEAINRILTAHAQDAGWRKGVKLGWTAPLSPPIFMNPPTPAFYGMRCGSSRECSTKSRK
jgi:IS5 family transposase